MLHRLQSHKDCSLKGHKQDRRAFAGLTMHSEVCIHVVHYHGWAHICSLLIALLHDQINFLFHICVIFCMCPAEADGSPAWGGVWWEAEGAEREERTGVKASVSAGQGNKAVRYMQVLLKIEVQNRRGKKLFPITHFLQYHPNCISPYHFRHCFMYFVSVMHIGSIFCCHGRLSELRWATYTDQM